MQRVLQAHPRIGGTQTLLPERLGYERRELGEDLLTGGPIDHCLAILGDESGCVIAWELGRPPFDNQTIAGTDQGDVRQPGAVRSGGQVVSRPPQLAGIEPLVFRESHPRSGIPPVAQGIAQRTAKRKASGPLLELDERPGSHQPIHRGSQRYVDARSNGLRPVQEVLTQVRTAHPDCQLRPRRPLGEIAALPGRRERKNLDGQVVAVADQHRQPSRFSRLRYSELVIRP